MSYNVDTVKQILHEVASGQKVELICKRYGISSATYYVWRRQYLNTRSPVIISIQGESVIITKKRYDQLRKCEEDLKRLKARIAKYIQA